MILSARQLPFKTLNERVRAAGEDVQIDDCCGQRYLGCAMSGQRLTVNGTPGNALGCYLNGGVIEVFGNAQDAVGDTMNDGKIIIHGNAGDALGYAMRGGGIYVRGDAGYRAGIHMKAYGEKRPVLVIGGQAGGFLGEYLAGGLILVLGIGAADVPLGAFAGTGMHGGTILVRSQRPPSGLPAQVSVEAATDADRREAGPHIAAFARYFGMDGEELQRGRYHVLKPNAKNPYKRLYTTSPNV